MPHQVDHRSTDHPPRRDASYVTAWADAFLLDTDRLDAERQKLSSQGDAMTTLDVQKVGLTMAIEALDDGSCSHPGALRLSRLVGCSQEIAVQALRVLRSTGWISITHKPTRTSPTVHRLDYPKGVQK